MSSEKTARIRSIELEPCEPGLKHLEIHDDGNSITIVMGNGDEQTELDEDGVSALYQWLERRRQARKPERTSNPVWTALCPRCLRVAYWYKAESGRYECSECRCELTRNEAEGRMRLLPGLAHFESMAFSYGTQAGELSSMMGL